jgi:CelD/BcsL family acetyltransferase involved in cellulose biosynthesis
MTVGSTKFNNYTITISSDYDIDVLRKQWLDIQNSEDQSFFLTWSWISAWISTYQPQILVVIANIDDNPVAIGLFTQSIQKRKGFISSNQIRLHQMGEPLKDQIWMEYNDFICLRGHRKDAVNACLAALNNNHQCDEVVLSMMPAQRAEEVVSENKHATLGLYSPCYAVSLMDLRLNKQNYVESLNSNTRYQIRRSLRIYNESFGPVNLEVAKNQKEAIDYFHAAAPFHIARWVDSGYLNRQFIRFHENLINQSYERGSIELLKISAGDKTIAILYYQLENKNVYFYLHGLNYDNNKKLKPGLVAHALATQYFIDKGMEKYDYMGGYSQYKEQLADMSEELATVVIQRPRSKFKLENIMKNMKERINSTSKKV